MKLNNRYCPIPPSQRPIYEYLKLKKSFLFSWPTLTNKSYYYKITFLLIINFCCFFPLVSLFFNSTKNTIELLIITENLVFFHLALIFIYVQFNWNSLNKKLNAPKIYYEESSWFDGKIWSKPIRILKQERLISYYQIVPILDRLQKTINFFLLLFLIGCFFSQI